jgi:alpha-amylase/alpha-mannosidase (GH57 family)
VSLAVSHLEANTPRRPSRVSPGDPVELVVATRPVSRGQSVWASVEVTGADGVVSRETRRGRWSRNEAGQSYWSIELGRFGRGDRLAYRVFAEGPEGTGVAGEDVSLVVGPKLHVALLWHHHQPLYREIDGPPRGAYQKPWVRLHALRDYVGMAALVAKHPRVHLTINLTPALLWQLDDYIEGGATDRALELTLKPADQLTLSERDEVVRTFFGADARHQIRVHPRYAELYDWRARGRTLGPGDLRDLQMWASLAWFGVEAREGTLELPGGQRVSVAHWVEQGHDFSQTDIESMVAEQAKLIAAVTPLHRALQDSGQIELGTTPFYHPILPLLCEARPDDADAQIERAFDDYRRRFGRPPRGVWPAHGAVSQAAVARLARHGARWLVSDRSVLALSGRHADDADTLCRPWDVEGASVFFRDSALSDELPRLGADEDPERAALDLVTRIKERFARRVTGAEPRVLTLALDGENAWGSHPRDARPLLSAFYRALESDTELETVTFSEALDGSPDRLLAPSVGETLGALATGSWAAGHFGELGSDLGHWVRAPEASRAWELLALAREAIDAPIVEPEQKRRALEAVLVAEGSDWLWWYAQGDDAEGRAGFDALFRSHLASAYRRAGLGVPPELERAIDCAVVEWSPHDPDPRLTWGSRLAIRTHCPGRLEWRIDEEAFRHHAMSRVRAEPSVDSYIALLGPFEAPTRELTFFFRCGSPRCARESAPCSGAPCSVRVGDDERPGVP